MRWLWQRFEWSVADLMFGLRQLARDLVGAVFGAREDEHRVERLVAQQMDEQIDLAALRHRVEELRDRLGGIGAAADLDRLRDCAGTRR